MSFSTALSGLNAAASDLNVKSNNIANVNTVGFKSSRAEFGDVFAVSAFGTSSKTAIGSGVVLSNVAQQFNQGNLEFTDNSLDLAISGEGFFAMAPTEDSGEIIYTRAGAFGINKDGFMVNSGGNFLRTFPVDVNGNISATSMSAAKPLQLPASQGAPEATTELKIATNLPSNADGIFNEVTPAISGALTATDTLVLSDFSSTNLVFTVQGDTATDTVTLNTNYTAPLTTTNILNDINTQLTVSGITASLSGGKLVFTDNTAGVNTNPVVTVTSAALAVDAQFAGSITTSAADAVFAPLAINPFDIATYSNSTSATVYDSLGNEHIITTYYQKVDEAVATPVGTDNQWRMEVFIAAADIKQPSSPLPVGSGTNQLVQLGSTTTVQFKDDGLLDSVLPSDPVLLNMTIGAGTELSSGAADLTVALNLTGSTQNSGSFAVGALTVNGFPTGRLTGVDVSDDGLIRATYSNGQAVAIGKIALANFANVQALNKIGNTAWKETTDSGPVIAGEAATGSFGKIQSGALETSNVDLTKELVGLITAQRNFQANSKSIETFNTITQTIINIR
ncbi:MAG: flagellar hook-basal body complex protein [Piscirickettsiaceae bacterium]|nr:flagellar hook-basal body complex protein [Piscirickettsiaceae bacterium]